jgi:GT2 family glycosyltransferase
MNSPLLSIIVLNYNGKQHNSRCLHSLLPQIAECELIFADNCSADGSFEAAREEFASAPILWVENGANLGYAGGNNAAARKASGRFLLFLNNDTEAAPDAIPQLRAYLQTYPGLAGGQCALVHDADRTRLQAAGVDVDIFGFCYDRSAGSAPDSVTNPEVIFTGNGAALVVSAEWFWRVGCFDESYFLLFEETDLCWRIGLAGGKLRYFPRARVYHVGSGTRMSGPAQVALFARNRVRTLRKNVGAVLLPFALAGHVLGMLLLSAICALRGAPDTAAATLRGVRQGLLDTTIRRRREDAQALRRLSDMELIRRGMLKLPNVRGLLANIARYA